MTYFYGLIPLPWWGYVLVALVTTQITIASVTVFLHRYAAHRALDLHPALCYLFRFWLWLFTGMVTIEWAAIHRKHHAKCETPDDPHSPQVLGLSKVMWEGAELYRKEARNQETLERYGHGLPNDWLEHKLFKPYSGKGYFFILALQVLLFGVPGIIIWAIQMAWIPFFAAGVVNGVGHYWGYRNFDCNDAARNISPLGILIGGEELHNNHHTYPTSAKLSAKWWEFDMGWLYICVLRLLGLAKVKRTIPKPLINSEKPHIDGETLSALISNRIQIMTKYTKSVLLPMMHDAKEQSTHEGKLWRRLKSLLANSENWKREDHSQKQRFVDLMAEFPSLQTTFQFRERLHEIWSRTTASQKDLIDALQEWCLQAEQTGIHGLQEFVKYIKGYSLRTSS